MGQTFSGADKIGQVVTAFPGASNLFKEYHIDFCCGGNRSLHTVLGELELDEAEFITILNQKYIAASSAKDTNVDWRQESFTTLIDHVVNTHHAYVQEELPILSEFTTKILRVHGPTHGETLFKLHRLFNQMRTELEQHLISEEEVVFPLIKQYEQNPSKQLLDHVLSTIDSLESEHSHVGDILKEMREVTSNYALPPEACRTYTLTFQKLEEFESDLFQHIHLENNILFPRLAEEA